MTRTRRVLKDTPLSHYITTRMNFRLNASGDTPIKFPPNRTEAIMIGESLSSDLSPENLHCDGEISRNEANTKYKFYMDVHAELERYVGTLELM